MKLMENLYRVSQIKMCNNEATILIKFSQLCKKALYFSYFKAFFLYNNHFFKYKV